MQTLHSRELHLSAYLRYYVRQSLATLHDRSLAYRFTLVQAYTVPF